MYKKILVLILLMLLIIPCSNVEAKTLGQLKSELTALEKKKASADANKNLTTEEINNIKREIATITKKIEDTKKEIKKAEEDIIKSEEEIAKKKEETNELLKFLQISSGENTYLEYIFKADSYTDFIYRFSVVSQLTTHNNKLMNELKVLVKELEEKKIEFNKKKKTLEENGSKLTTKMSILNANLKEYEEEGTTIEEDIADTKKEIKRCEDRGCKDNEDIATCGMGNGLINASGWTYPLKWGCVTSEYVGFGYRPDWSGPAKGHHGIDLDCVNEGTTVYAAAPGVVARTVYHSSCGGNMIWIYHYVNGRPYTTVYMHLLNISVSPGQAVGPATKIGEVGGGSTQSYDRCTGGTHLHFGMAYGHHSSGFNNYSFNPRNLYAFPKLVYNGGGYFNR